VGLVSAGILSYEILLVRVFAIEQFHHFAYMAIGVAMLGFGASGTLLALAGNVERAAAERWFPWVAVVAAATLVLCPATAERLAVDPTQLAWNAGAWPRLAGVYLLLALPFASGALTILLALSRHVDRPGRVYGASFVGSGLGAAAAVGVLWLLPPDRALAAPALCAAVAAIVAARSVEWRLPARGLAWLTLVIALGAMARPPWRLEITPYKGLPQVEAYPEARRVASASSPAGWVAAVDAPAFRYAPGLSLGFRGEFPRQVALFVDGHLTGAVADWESDSAALALLEWLPAALPYALGARDRVLVIGAGGGTEVWTALAHGARHVTASELLPAIVTLTTETAPRLADTTVRWRTGDARSFVSRTTQTFDLVSVGPTGGLGTGAAGLHALNEDFLHTVEAYTSYLELLSDRGVLMVSRWLTAPPRGSVRAILTAAEALRRVAPDSAHRGLVVARSWGTVTLLAKPGGFDATELEALRTWATARQLDLDWYPGLDAPASRFHILEEPVVFNAARAAVAGGSELRQFAATYPFDVAPATDARPYPHHFLRGRSLGTFLRADQGSWLPFAEWGYIALVATLVQSAVLATLLMLLPAVIRTSVRGNLVGLIAYFGAIGLAYLAAEIAAIQQLSLLLGHPVYAVAAVLTALLIGSGIGSLWSDRLGIGTGWITTAVLAAALAMFGLVGLSLVHASQPAPIAVRAGMALIALAPVAVLMGMPFPLGLRRLAGRRPERVAWAWAANGFASVVAAPIAALVALEWGSPLVLGVAALTYGGAATLYRFQAETHTGG
jgi:spermidine synthase